MQKMFITALFIIKKNCKLPKPKLPNYINYGMSKNIIDSQKLVLLIMREHNIMLSLN